MVRVNIRSIGRRLMHNIRGLRSHFKRPSNGFPIYLTRYLPYIYIDMLSTRSPPSPKGRDWNAMVQYFTRSADDVVIPVHPTPNTKCSSIKRAYLLFLIVRFLINPHRRAYSYVKSNTFVSGKQKYWRENIFFFAAGDEVYNIIKGGTLAQRAFDCYVIARGGIIFFFLLQECDLHDRKFYVAQIFTMWCEVFFSIYFPSPFSQNNFGAIKSFQNFRAFHRKRYTENRAHTALQRNGGGWLFYFSFSRRSRNHIRYSEKTKILKTTVQVQTKYFIYHTYNFVKGVVLVTIVMIYCCDVKKLKTFIVNYILLYICI